MKRMQLKHWQDPVTALLGAWFSVSPWVLGFQDNTSAMAASIAIGLALVVTGLGAMLWPKAWEPWVTGALGVGALASPWLLGFADLVVASRNAMIVGAAAVVLAAWVLVNRGEHGWGHNGLAH